MCLINVASALPVFDGDFLHASITNVVISKPLLILKLHISKHNFNVVLRCTCCVLLAVRRI